MPSPVMVDPQKRNRGHLCNSTSRSVIGDTTQATLSCHRKDPTMEGLSFHPLPKERWADFKALFGARGAVGGYWCMT